MGPRRLTALALLAACAHTPDAPTSAAAQAEPEGGDAASTLARVKALDVFAVEAATPQVDSERLARFASAAEAASKEVPAPTLDQMGMCPELEAAAAAALANVSALDVVDISDLALEEWPSQRTCYSLPCDDADREVEKRNCARRAKAIAIAGATKGI